MKFSHESVVIISCFLFSSCAFNEDVLQDVEMAEIQSCRGCALNRLPEVKAFIYEDLNNYDDVIFKPIPGAPPELVLYDSKHQEVRRIPLSDKSREECNNLLKKWGFSSRKEEEAHKISQEQEL